MKQTWKIEART